MADKNNEKSSFLDKCIVLGALYLLFTSGQTYFSDQNKFGEVKLVRPSVITLDKLPEVVTEPEAKVSKEIPNSEGIIKAANGLPGGVSVFTESGYRVVGYNAKKPLEAASNVKAATTLAILLNNTPEVIKENLPAIYDMMAYSDNTAARVLGQKLVGSPKDIQRILKKTGIETELSSWSGYNGHINEAGGPRLPWGETSYISADNMVRIIMATAREAKAKGIDISQVLGNTLGPGTLHIHQFRDKDTGKIVIMHGKTGTLHDTKVFSGYLVTKKGVKIFVSVMVNAENGRSFIPHINRILQASYYS